MEEIMAYGDITSLITDLGITGNLAINIIQAQSNPTSQNIKSLQAAFNSSGISMPTALLNELVSANQQQYPFDPVSSGTNTTLILIVVLIGLAAIKWLKK
jgi:hypothetical protein